MECSIFDAQTVEDVIHCFNNGDDLNAIRESRTPLINAIIQDREDIVDALILCGARTNKFAGLQSPAIYSILKGNLNITKKILHPTSINTKQKIEQPLATASRKDHLHIVDWLIDNDADVNGNGALTPFYLACCNGHLDVAKLLQHSGARTYANILPTRPTQTNLPTQTNYFRSPLVGAACAGQHVIVDYLLANDLDHENEEEAYIEAYLNNDEDMLDIMHSYDIHF